MPRESIVYLQPNEVCAANAYVRPEFRGLNILNYARACIYKELKKMGYDRVITFVSSKNKSAMRMHHKFGSVPIACVKNFNIFTLCHSYTNLKSNEIVFQGGILIRWNKLFCKMLRKYPISSEKRDQK